MAKTRIQFDMSSENVKELKTLMRLCGISTMKDFLGNAVALLRWCVQEVRSGRTIVSMDDKNKTCKELVMPWMSEVKNNKEIS